MSALLVSASCYAGACGFIYGAVGQEYGTKIAKRTALLISIAPFGFYFGAMMPESLFLLTVAAFLYYLPQHKWNKMMFWGILATMSRMHGVVLLIPAMTEWFTYYKPAMAIREKNKLKLGVMTKALCNIFAIFLGTCVYFLCNFVVAGSPFYFLKLQSTFWGNGFEIIGKAIWDVIKSMFWQQDTTMLISIVYPQVVILLLVIILLVVYCNKVNPNYIILLSAYFVLSYSQSFLISGARYMCVAIPVFLLISLFIEKYPKTEKVIIIIFSFLFALYMTAYLFGKQVM